MLVRCVHSVISQWMHYVMNSFPLKVTEVVLALGCFCAGQLTVFAYIAT